MSEGWDSREPSIPRGRQPPRPGSPGPLLEDPNALRSPPSLTPPRWELTSPERQATGGIPAAKALGEPEPPQPSAAPRTGGKWLCRLLSTATSVQHPTHRKAPAIPMAAPSPTAAALPGSEGINRKHSYSPRRTNLRSHKTVTGVSGFAEKRGGFYQPEFSMLIKLTE